MSNNNATEASFWQFLKNNKIEIPIIQRDYAQGRIGKEKLREKFLKELKDALDDKLRNPDNKSSLKLDFVYGSSQSRTFQPLDGQQRLTTLWLLHWYIAYKAGKLQEQETKDIFSRFTYGTRISSREFCEGLSSKFIENTDDVVEAITNQTWFYSAWKQDPTIQSMLIMLGGTDKKGEKNEEIIDGINELFYDIKKIEPDYYKKLWDLLTNNEKCPIKFFQLELPDLGLTDDLFIKMNARGKALTSFENFKADLIGHLKNKGWEKEKKLKNTIAYKLDTTWTDIFWNYKSLEQKIDEIYFAFFNHYFLNCLICAKDNEGYYYAENKIEGHKTYKQLYRTTDNDSDIQYERYDDYNPVINNAELFTWHELTILKQFLIIFIYVSILNR